MGRYSSVGIVTGYRLDGLGIKSQWGARFSTPDQTGPGAHPASCTMGTGSFPRKKNGWGVTLTPLLLLVPWSRKSRAICLLPLRAEWPLQSLSACTRVHFAFLRLLTITFITTQDDYVIGNVNGEDNCVDVYKIHCQKIGNAYFCVKFNVVYSD